MSSVFDKKLYRNFYLRVNLITMKKEMIMLWVKAILLIAFIFIFITVIKIAIGQSLFFIRYKFGDKVLVAIIGLIVLYSIVASIIKYLKKRNQQNF